MKQLLQRAEMLIGQGRYELALEELSQVLAADPNHAHSHCLSGLCLSQLEKYDEAEASVRRAIELAPDTCTPYYVCSIVLLERNRLADAEKAISTAIELDPYNEDYFAQAAAVKLQQKQWKAALTLSEEGLKLDPEHEQCVNLRAIALVKLGRKAEADDVLESTLRRDPENPMSHANLGWAKLEQSKPREAMVHFREALRLEPEMEWARLGIVEAMKGHYFIYRILLNFFLWIEKLEGRTKWMVLLGGYFGYRYLGSLARDNPALAPFLMPLIIAYVGFAILTWVGDTIFNFLLWLNPFGRLALSDEEKRTSVWVGSAIIFAIVYAGLYFPTGELLCLLTALSLAFMTPALATYYGSSKGWPRAVHQLLLFTMMFLAFNVAVATIGMLVSGEQFERRLEAIAKLSAIPLLLLGFASQFGVHFLTAARPEKGTDKAKFVRWVGGATIAIAVFLLTGLNLLMLFFTPTS